MDLETRAGRHAALGDPIRLAVAEALTRGDLSPAELGASLGVRPNLLAHHLEVLEAAGLVRRTRSEGDGRRRYVSLVTEAARDLGLDARPLGEPVLFVCTQNSARSQIAAALWRTATGGVAGSAGTEPASRVHPMAVAVAGEAGIDLTGASPRHLDDAGGGWATVVTVCDRAHEALSEPTVHWSTPDPAPIGTRGAFVDALTTLEKRVRATGARSRTPWHFLPRPN